MIELAHVTKVYPTDTGEVRAVDDVSFTVDEGETLCLIGTSGSGKTTAMRMINRLEEPTTGTVRTGGRPVTEQDATMLRRSIGYVIQRGGLFPHMTVARNIGLLCELEGYETARTTSRVQELLDLVGLPPDTYQSRYPRELSGGQQQRVSVARALALDPPIVLMDEPFGALDPLTRRQLHREFLSLQDILDKTMVIVTHDMDEAFLLGDRIGVMDAGKMVQCGTADELRAAPANDFVRDLLEAATPEAPGA